jgi:hypothetical protein
MNVGENGLAGAIGIELMAELFNEPIAGAGGGHDHDVGQEGVGQGRAQTLGQERQQLLR